MSKFGSDPESSPSGRVTVAIDRIVPGGYGIGFAEGATFFVPLTAPGDVVSVSVLRRKGKIVWGEAVNVLEFGPSRIEPACVYYGICGGCDLQHLAYEAQIKAKREIVMDCLRRIAGIEMPEFAEFVVSSEEFGYRARVRWHCAGGKIGFRRRNSHEIVDIERCPILLDRLNDVLDKIGEASQELPPEMEASVDSGGNAGLSPDIFNSSPELETEVAGEEYRYSADCFFQANTTMLEPLVKAAVQGLSGERSLDLYCGVGLFTLPLARRFGEVVGVEGSDVSASFARLNADNAGLKNISIYNRNVELFCSIDVLNEYDAVLLDPPRSGPAPALIANLAKSDVRTVSYVSCEPSMLARDLKILLAGGYRMSEFTMLDLFPQTHHVETVVRLIRQ
jgi:23S rRNA (uracil1939-C5)-methyltransferase